MAPQTTEKRLPISTTLGYLGFVGLLACFLWMPSLIPAALEDHEINRHAVTTMGKVVSHESWMRRQTRYYSASVEYIANGRAFTVGIRGDGASAQRLPLGAPVEVRYLARRPDLAQASTTDASTFRISLLLVVCAGAVPLLLFLASYLTRSRKAPAVPLNAA